jgi:hypothetical protein
LASKPTPFLYPAALIAAVTKPKDCESWAADTTEEEKFKAFAALHPVNVHIHVFKTAPEFRAILQQKQLRLLNILVVNDNWTPRRSPAED